LGRSVFWSVAPSSHSQVGRDSVDTLGCLKPRRFARRLQEANRAHAVPRFYQAVEPGFPLWVDAGRRRRRLLDLELAVENAADQNTSPVIRENESSLPIRVVRLLVVNKLVNHLAHVA